MNKLYREKHNLWLEILFASFAIDDEEIKSRLYDFSLIAFRHMKWIGISVLENGKNYNYDRDIILYKRENVFDVLNNLKEKVELIQEFYPQDELGFRMKNDDTYLLEYISQLLKDSSNNKSVTAFNMARKWLDKNLPQDQIDALTMFLFDESYKEYELILVYAYMQTRTNDIKQYNVYQDLIDESYFHLKSFANMMAKLGILALPRELHEMTYTIKDLDKFIKDGIDEEIAAKEMCKELSEAIKDEELSKFFDFINYQENYHIELMKKLLKTSVFGSIFCFIFEYINIVEMVPTNIPANISLMKWSFASILLLTRTMAPISHIYMYFGKSKLRYVKNAKTVVVCPDGKEVYVVGASAMVAK